MSELNSFVASNKETKLDYQNDTYKFESESTVLSFGKNEKGFFIILNETIFHPQGGGQPTDSGTIEIDEKVFVIFFVGSINGVVFHYYNENPFLELDLLIGKKAKLNVDQEKRINHAKAHTSGHLLSCVVERLAPELKGFKGYHFVEGPYVEFHGKLTSYTNDELIQNAVKLMQDAISNQSQICVSEQVNDNDGNEKKLIRTIQIDSFDKIPCGGTHLKNISELKQINIRKVQFSKGNTKISYSFL